MPWGKLYYWFWHDVCKRPEPFTHSMRRSFKANPLPWIITPIGLGTAWWLLMAHLGGFI